MIRGTIVNIGGTDYTVPPFNMGLWERFDAQIKAYDQGDDKSVVGMVRGFVPMIAENIQRNYPEFSVGPDEWDLPTFLEARAACLATSRPANPPGAPSSPSTGAA